jgi:polyisoprenoid-binding protein YceI
MKITNSLHQIGIFIFFMALGLHLQAQEKLNFTNHDIVIEGTSNIHDWEMDVEKVDGFIQFNTDNDFNINDISLSIPVKSLKSGKGKMDSNTYEALKEKKNSHIRFSFIETTSIEKTGVSTYKAIVKGNLSIAGTTQIVSIPLIINTDKKNLTANYNLKMTDYNVSPPTAVFGTIKTGDSVQLNFNLNY